MSIRIERSETMDVQSDDQEFIFSFSHIAGSGNCLISIFENGEASEVIRTVVTLDDLIELSRWIAARSKAEG